MLVKRRSLLNVLRPGLATVEGSPTRRRLRLRLLRIAGALLGGGTLLVVILAGIHNLSWIWRNRVLPEVNNFHNWISSASAKPRHLDIDIKFKDFQWLAYNRQKAFDFGKIVQHEDSYVPAKIRLPDRTVKVKMRLKGGATDHLEGDKWSYRIKVTGDDTIFGMSFFSIQDPVRSSFVYEWVFHEIMRYAGLIAPRYDFIHVTINGKPMGIYALEESFSKELVEAHDRREGPIVRLNESKLFVKDLPYHQREIFFAAQIDAFQSGKTNTDPVLRRQFAIARDLLERFRDQQLPVDQVFDLDKAATYFALIDLCSASHAARWKNIRFYYDPVTSLLEPIPYNAYTSRSAAGCRKSPARWLSGQYVYSRFHVAEWMDAFFKDPTFYRAYVHALERISSPEFIDRFFVEIDDRLQENIRIIHTDAPAFNYSKDYILSNARMIRNAVRPQLPIRAQFDLDKDSMGTPLLRVANTVRLAIEPTAIVDRRGDTRYPFQQGLVIAPKSTDVPRDVTLIMPHDASGAFTDFEDGDLDLAYHVVGMSEEYLVSIQRRRSTAEKNLLQRLAENLDAIKGMEALRIDEASKVITVKPGRWRFDRSVYVPAGYRLEAGPGVTIELYNGASLITYSPVRFVGTAGQPVVITCPDADAGGLAVIDAGEESHLRHVHFENLASPAEGLWAVTGAVTMYESPAHIVNCRFVAGRAEDQLNIVRTRFVLEASDFTASDADALDVDFSRGTISDCTFTGIGNDAVDLSGSTVTVDRCAVKGAGDKALSAGENSSVSLRDFKASDCRFGLVSKDLSAVTAQDVTIRGADVALAVYQKKPEYGPASISILKLHTEETSELSLIEKGSWINVDGHETRGVTLAVARAIYGE